MSRCWPAASRLNHNLARYGPPRPRRPSCRTRLPVVVSYRPRTTTPLRPDAGPVSTYACEPVLLRTTRYTPVRRCSTLRAWRTSGPAGALVGRIHASEAPLGSPGPLAKPSIEPPAVSDTLPKLVAPWAP